MYRTRKRIGGTFEFTKGAYVMDFYEAVYRRRTIRDFAEKDVPAETVNRILQAGLKAPPTIIFANGSL